MQTVRLSILFISLLAIAAGSCKKDPKDNTEVTFTNQTSEKVTLDIYASEKDYGSGANVLIRKVLSPNENTLLPGSTFQSGTSYYMDWYTDDLEYHNWFNDDYPVASTGTSVAFRPVPGQNTYYMKPQAASGARKVFLKAGLTSSRWTTAGVYAYSKATGYVSYWNHLTPHEKFHEITINKDFTAEYSYQNETGSVVTETFDFMVHNTAQGYIELKDAAKQTEGSLVTGRLPAADGSEYISASEDSLMALLPHSDYYFLMVRSL